MLGYISVHDTVADTSLAHTTSRTQGLDLTSASVGCSIPGAAFAHLPSLKEGQDNSKGAADRKKASLKPSGGVLTFLQRLRPGRPSINRVANRTPSTSHPSLDSWNAWQALSETSGSEDNKVRLAALSIFSCFESGSQLLSQVASICIMHHKYRAEPIHVKWHVKHARLQSLRFSFHQRNFIEVYVVPIMGRGYFSSKVLCVC